MCFSKVLITGATSGIGEALARKLASTSDMLLLTGRDKKKLAVLKEELPTNTTTLPADLTTEEGQNSVVALIQSHAPDLIINNAGMTHYGLALNMDTQAQKDILTVNGQAPLTFTLEGARALKKRGIGGVILNVASVAGLFSAPLMGVYGAAKAFVIQFSKALDFELRPNNIRVLVSCPGQVTTPFAKRAANNKALSPDKRAIKLSSAVDEILWQIHKKKRVHVFDWRYKLATILVPKFLIEKQIFANIEQRIKQKA